MIRKAAPSFIFRPSVRTSPALTSISRIRRTSIIIANVPPPLQREIPSPVVVEHYKHVHHKRAPRTFRLHAVSKAVRVKLAPLPDPPPINAAASRRLVTQVTKNGRAALRTTLPKCLSGGSALLFNSEKHATRNRVFLVLANVEEEFIYITQKVRWNNIARILSPGRDRIIDLRPLVQWK